MDEIKKMIRFDYVNCIGIGGKYAYIFAALAFAACLLGAYPAALGFIIAPLALFSPVETIRKGDFMKIYGLLPVKRESIIKALFAEILIPQTIGGILGELCLLISRAIGESGIRQYGSQHGEYGSELQQLVRAAGGGTCYVNGNNLPILRDKGDKRRHRCYRCVHTVPCNYGRADDRLFHHARL